MSYELLLDNVDCLAVNKPAGMTVIPARGEPPEASLQHRLQAQLGARLWVVHRIDRDTSGVVLFARNAEAHRELSMAFEERRVEKTYLAFVAGDLRDGTIDVPLHAARKGKARPARANEPGAREAITDVRVLCRWAREEMHAALVEARPSTGRLHQIRVHLRYAGAPILFDPLYAPRAALEAFADAPCKRLALHAARVALPDG